MAQPKHKKSVTKSKTTVTAVNRGRPSSGQLAHKKLLLHHRHSFNLVHHRHTSYPVLLFIILLSSLFCVAWTAFANGESYSVNAVIPAAALPVAATIDAPSDGQIFKVSRITVTGTCPAHSYVKLSRNHVFSGTALCQADGTWSIPIELVAGANFLDAQDYNVTNQPGPDSNGITVSYDQPVVPADTPAATAGPTAAKTDDQPSKTIAVPLILGSNFSYQGYFAGQLANWDLTIDGGSAPYAVQVDWGDGETNLKSLSQPGAFSLQHSYGQAGQYANSYTIKISATDADGQTTVLQLFVIISPQQTGSGSSGLAALGGGAGSGGASTGAGVYQQFWRIAGPTYAVVFVSVGSFWLGELRELKLLRPHGWHGLGHHW